MVSGEFGEALCDFLMRIWKSLPFPRLVHSKWLGSNHVVSLTTDNQQLVLISRDRLLFSDGIMRIPLEGKESKIKFIDTYNNWQLLLQIDEEIHIFAFDPETKGLTFVRKFSNIQKSLKQAAFVKENLVTLTTENYLQINNCIPIDNCESFLILSTGNLLLKKHDGLILFKDQQEISIEGIKGPITAVLPFANCFTLLHSDELNFSLNSPLQSRFLLPELIETGMKEEILKEWMEDPLYPLALEYILLKSLGKAAQLIDLNHMHDGSAHKQLLFSRVLVQLTRKIEVHQASHQLFNHLPSFSPDQITKIILKSKLIQDCLNFLPYLAKSYFESVANRKDSILLILDALFTGRRWHTRIRKVREYLSAFADLENLFDSALQGKIQSLWQSGRLIKAHSLIVSANFEDNVRLTDIDDGNENEDIYLLHTRIDAISCPKLIPELRTFLETRHFTKCIHLLDRL